MQLGAGLGYDISDHQVLGTSLHIGSQKTMIGAGLGYGPSDQLTLGTLI